MCKRISPDMVLYYALSTHDSVSSIELSRLHRELLSQIRELIVDTTLSSIQNVVRERENLFELEQNIGSYTVRRRSASSSFFDQAFLDRCYSPFFEENDFEKIREILVSINE